MSIATAGIPGNALLISSTTPKVEILVCDISMHDFLYYNIAYTYQDFTFSLHPRDLYQYGYIPHEAIYPRHPEATVLLCTSILT